MEMDLKQQLGARIKELRAARSLTQEIFAEVIGISSRSMSFIETGKNFPSAETLTRICGALQVPPHQLFYFGKHPELDQVKAELIRKIRDDDEFASFVYKAAFNLN